MITTIDALRFTFGLAGNACALIIFLAPIIKFKKIVRDKSTNDISGISFVMNLFECLLTAWYGLPFVSTNNLLVTLLYGIGAIVQSIYILIFIFYSPREKKLRISGLVMLVVILFSTVVIVSMFALHGNMRNQFVGQLSTIFSIIMLGDPLLAMRKMIKTGSLEDISFFLSLTLFLFYTCWYIFGTLAADPFIYIPNGVGTAIGAIHIILYFIYRNKRGSNQGSESTAGVV